MVRFEIVTYVGHRGYVEVADDHSVTYEYTGPDPEDAIVPYLEDLAAGEITHFDGGDDVADRARRLSAEAVLLEIAANLRGHDPVWFVDYEDGFNSGYGR